MADLPMIDSHQHFWQVGRFDYPWMTSDNAVLYRDYLPAQLEPVLKENGVAKTVLVQASNSVEESRWLLSLAEENGFIAGVVGWVDLLSQETASQLEELTGDSKFKGVRHLVESEPDDDWLVEPQVLSNLRLLSAFNLSFDLLVHTRHLRYARVVADQCPDLPLVIDHMAKPAIARGEFQEWSRELRPLADFPNVHCKLSGLVTEANWTGWTTDDLRPYVDYALELFGPERLMFGSDYPVCLLAASYKQVLESFQELLKDLTNAEREHVFASNAARFYRLN
ncbi:MAG TPA: amidohydrolase family protein [Pyrinomonadaceae bacterium]|nr:amidohydrolase family protein [Pyrinomonadaceae bacterium]